MHEEIEGALRPVQTTFVFYPPCTTKLLFEIVILGNRAEILEIFHTNKTHKKRIFVFPLLARRKIRPKVAHLGNQPQPTGIHEVSRFRLKRVLPKTHTHDAARENI